MASAKRYRALLTMVTSFFASTTPILPYWAGRSRARRAAVAAVSGPLNADMLSDVEFRLARDLHLTGETSHYAKQRTRLIRLYS